MSRQGRPRPRPRRRRRARRAPRPGAGRRSCRARRRRRRAGWRAGRAGAGAQGWPVRWPWARCGRPAPRWHRRGRCRPPRARAAARAAGTGCRSSSHDRPARSARSGRSAELLTDEVGGRRGAERRRPQHGPRPARALTPPAGAAAPSPTRDAYTIATARSSTRRARYDRKAIEASSAHCASSMQMNSGWSAGQVRRQPVQAVQDRARVGPPPPRAGAAPTGVGRRGRPPPPASARGRRVGRHQRSFEELAHDAVGELALELAAARSQHAHAGVAARRPASASRDVLPIPASPSTAMTDPASSTAAAMARSSRSTSPSRSSNPAPTVGARLCIALDSRGGVTKVQGASTSPRVTRHVQDRRPSHPRRGGMTCDADGSSQPP